MHLIEPPIKKIDLQFKLGMTNGMVVTARNLKGVTIKDAMDAIHKPHKKKVRLVFSQAARFSSDVHLLVPR